MELSAEQKIERDALHTKLVAQGGPLVGKLKAAGHKDPDGVARLVELGWVNPEAEDIEPVHTCGECISFGSVECQNRVKDEVACSDLVLEAVIPTVEEIDDALEDATDEFAEAEDAAAKAQKEADKAIKAAEKAAEVAESKRPPPCVRCNGDGFWHSTKTGYRAKTSSEPLIDTERTCPLCK